MFSHYFKIALRNLWKHKNQSLIGIFGLAFGLACFVPALYWMRYETSYDGFYPGAENIYRIYSVEKESANVRERVPGILERELHEKFPAVEGTACFSFEPDTYRTEEIPGLSLNTLYTDTSFFRVFPQQVIAGDPRQPMTVVHNVVLTEATAVRLFGSAEKALGGQIESDFQSMVKFPPYTVTAVVEDPPGGTNLPFDLIIFADWYRVDDMPLEGQWEMASMDVYAKLHPRADAAGMAEQLREVKGNGKVEYRMLPVADIRHQLSTDLPFTLNFIRLFMASGALLLFCALFNFLNLYLDLFRQRLRELRLRTVHGATDGQLIAQMTFELACTLLLALMLAGFFVALFRPQFVELSGIKMDLLPIMRLFAVCGAGTAAAVLLIGLVPLWRLSRSAARYLATGKSTGAPLMRRVAVSLQLAVSVVFLVAAGVVMMQMRYASRKDPGFDRSGVVQLFGPFTTMYMNTKTLKDELAKVPSVEEITLTDFEPRHSAGLYTVSDVEWPGKPANEQPVFQTVEADDRFAEVFGLNMLVGGWWNEGDNRKVVLNQEAVRVMGLADPVGSVIRISAMYIADDGSVPMREYTVAGVVSDFHTLSLRSRIAPTIFRANAAPNRAAAIYFRVAPGREAEAIGQITGMLPTIDESFAEMSLTPLDEVYDRLNYSEQAGLKLFSLLAAVCLLISLLGIYAVATAASRRRRKEIAVRKVYGADARTIVRMFFREYTWQVVWAGVVALPVVYYAMSRWLQGYAYRTNIPWWLLAGVLAAVIAVVLLTVWNQVTKAANGNPAEVVKSE